MVACLVIILSISSLLQVQCFPIYSVLMALGNPVVDYFSLDIEGAEYNVLETIPFNNTRIKLFGIEVVHAGKIFNGTQKDIDQIMSENGFVHVGTSHSDKFYKKRLSKNDIFPKNIIKVI